MNFTYSSLINAPIEKVWQFHEREDILQILTPPWQPVEIVRREGGLEVGAVSEFRIWIGVIPVTWIARHIECEPYHVFVDRQESGPLHSWIHRHEFRSESEKTRLTDSIEYAVTDNESVNSLLNGWVNARLTDMFRYRHRVTEQALER
ncbi:SRPBCC family protein [Pannus brasiliensis CCIBt3594]|uniref:SRPBCC family protein n=1 Tax=Pannus brasiliensis CCIBt3594 TaxID=1427578 RepID=A0AAW9QS24_9CHRO